MYQVKKSQVKKKNFKGLGTCYESKRPFKSAYVMADSLKRGYAEANIRFKIKSI